MSDPETESVAAKILLAGIGVHVVVVAAIIARAENTRKNSDPATTTSSTPVETHLSRRGTTW